MLGRLFHRRARASADLRARLERLPRTPTFAFVTSDRAAVRDVAYPAMEVVDDLARATAEFVVFVSPGESVAPDALVVFAERIETAPDADVLYSDEVGGDGDRFHKPDWSPELLLAQPYALRLAAMRRELVTAAGGLRAPADTAAEWDLLLRVTERARRVEHVADLLCRGVRPRRIDDDARRVVTEAAIRRGLRATVARCPHAPVFALSVEPQERPPVTIVVPTRDRLDLVRRCVDSVLARTKYPHFVVQVVDNGSVEPATIAQFDAWRRDPRVVIRRDDRPFDYAALMNDAVAAVTTPLVLFLNNDTEVIAERWLDEMVGWIERPGIGAVGAKLYYENGTVQHAGVVLGIGGVATHGHKGAPREAPGYHGILHCVRDVSAATGACLLTRRDLFTRLGGFDRDLRVAYNDVDYCLRVRRDGQRVLVTPFAELYHFEGRSRGDDSRGQHRFEREIALMQQRWGPLLQNDPFYNPHLSLRATDYRLR